MKRDFDSVPDEIRDQVRSLIPADVDKCVRYDVKRNPGKYVGVTLKLCQLAKDEDKVCFMPTRRSNIPCHAKMDTECVSQAFVPYAERSAARKEAASIQRLGVGQSVEEKSRGQEVGEEQIQVPPRDHDGWHLSVAAVFQATYRQESPSRVESQVC